MYLQVALIGKLHHYTQGLRRLVVKCLLVAHYVRVVDRSQKTDLIQGIFFVLLLQSMYFYLSE